MEKQDELIAKFLRVLDYINEKYETCVLSYEDMCILTAGAVRRFTRRLKKHGIKVERQGSKLIIWRRKKRPEYIT